MQMVIPTIDANTPGDGNALEEEQPEKGPTGSRIEVKQLEHVETALKLEGRLPFNADNLPHLFVSLKSQTNLCHG